MISGAALITPLGLTRQQTWEAVCQGRCGMGALTALEQELPADRNGGQCPELPAAENPELSREVRYLRRAIRDALVDAQLTDSRPYAAESCGILLGTTLHGMRAGGRFLRADRHELLADFLAGSTLRGAAEGVAASGLRATTCSACSSSLGSITMAVSLLRAGELDLVIAGGYDTISEYVYAGFNSLRLVAAGHVRPFTKDREGMKLSEGYGIVVLERAGDAQSRGKRSLATILGYGESADAHHLTQPHPQGEGAARAIRAALRSAELSSDDIDLVAAHATGTPDNDASEYAALLSVFGKQLPEVPVVAFKSHLGHTLGGAGAVELILSALCLRDQLVPACANVRTHEIEFQGLQLSTGSSQSKRIRATLNTSLGFGGANTCVILGPAPMQQQMAHVAPQKNARDVFITGIGVILPGSIGNEQFVKLLRDHAIGVGLRDSGPIPESDFAHLLNARRIRRMSEYVKLSLAATMLAMRDANVSDIAAFAESCSAVLGTTHGSTNYCQQYYGQIVREGMEAANPTLFAEGVPNAAAAHLSLMLSLKGPCQTVIGTRTAGLDALRLAAMRIAGGEWDRAIVGAAEEYSALINETYRRWGLYAGSTSSPFGKGCGFAAGSGAVTFVLESASSMAARNIVPRGQVLSAYGPASLNGQKSTEAIWKALGAPRFILSSANCTWLDRMESAAIRRGTSGAIVSSLYGYIAETFSVMPLAAIASVLLTGRMPNMHSHLPESKLVPARGEEHPEVFTSLASDYTAVLSGVTIALPDRARIAST